MLFWCFHAHNTLFVNKSNVEVMLREQQQQDRHLLGNIQIAKMFGKIIGASDLGNGLLFDLYLKFETLGFEVCYCWKENMSILHRTETERIFQSSFA